jgi:hypothetical protein
MTRFISWLLVICLLGAFGAAAVHLLRLRAASGVGMPEYSIFSEQDNGLAPAARLLEQLGWRPTALTRLVSPAYHRGLLILVEKDQQGFLLGQDDRLSKSDAANMLRWVEAGNALLVCSRNNSKLADALDVVVAKITKDQDETPHRLEVDSAGPYTEGLDRIEVEGKQSLSAERGLPLWWQEGQPAALLIPKGAGRVILVSDPSFLTARRLHRGADNLLFLANVAMLHARDGRIYFDEYHHGIQASGGFWGFLQYHGQQFALVPLVLVVLIAIWAVAVRLGPAVPTPRTTGADAVDYASAVARIYHRTGARRILARGLARGFLSRLGRALNTRPSALPAEMLAAWRQRHPKDSRGQLDKLLRAAGEMRTGDITDGQLLAWTQSFDEFEQELTVRK